MASKNVSSRHAAALDVLAAAGGPIRLMVMRAAGVHVQTIRELVGWGTVSRLGRGFYRLADAMLSDGLEAYAEAAARHPDGVISGPSAAFLHGLLDNEPDHIEISLPRRQRSSGRGVRVGVGIAALPLRTRAVSEDRLTLAIVHILAAGSSVAVTDPARTVAEILARRALRDTYGAEVQAALAAKSS